MLDAVTEKIEGKSSREVGGKKKIGLQICGKDFEQKWTKLYSHGSWKFMQMFPREGPVSIRESSQRVLIQQVIEWLLYEEQRIFAEVL